MPARAVFIAVSAAIAAGIVVYHERERLLELLDRTSRKVALSLSQIAEDFNPRPRQTEHPMTSRAPPRPRTPSEEQWTEEEKAFIFDEKPTDTEARKRDEDTFGAASGWEGRDGAARDVRRRGSPLAAPADGSVLFDTAPASPAGSSTPTGTAVKVPGSVTCTSFSRRSSSATLSGDRALPNLPPPLPPKPQALAQEAIPTAAAVAAEIVSPLQTPDVLVTTANADSSRTASSSSDHEGRQTENPFGNSQPYWSIHEWAENTTLGSGSRSPSIAGSAAEEIPQPADEILSEFGSEDESVGSWTEVGSSIHSDDDN
ncbi:unnamed protein product [Tuber melanosporum]|uniref:(Perigord truffle) hypothetical protein n=1 Tax=Tuber melanosporum (strain Mel28) TaxID=656061 RepID=D5GNE5_TUBMM|nr:uncharacterized protein GSTUM_00011247001 [Tuber melanosporum]CAZ86038.1 unnamed protein product [Tuber melanosporum]